MQNRGLVFAALAASFAYAQVDAAPQASAVFFDDPAKIGQGPCTTTTLKRDDLTKYCGDSTTNPCPVFIKAADETAAGVKCDAEVELETIDTEWGVVRFIHGVVAGIVVSTEMKSEIGLTYGAFDALCPVPCIDANAALKCVKVGEDCPTGFDYAPPVTVDSTAQPVVSNAAAGTTSSPRKLNVSYKFDPAATTPGVIDPIESAPLPDVTNVVDAEFVVKPIAIADTDTIGCGSESGTAYTKDQAVNEGTCGDSSKGQPPCPLSADFTSKQFGECYDSSKSGKCYDITFNMSGLTDDSKIYCDNPVKSYTVTKRFALVHDSKDENVLQLPMGAWKDICPFQCSVDAADLKTQSGICAKDKADCKFTVPDAVAPGDWAFVPSSSTAKIQFAKAVEVDCVDPTSTTTTTTTTTTTSTTKATTTTSTTKKNGAAGRGAVGGLTAALLVACAVVYNF